MATLSPNKRERNPKWSSLRIPKFNHHNICLLKNFRSCIAVKITSNQLQSAPSPSSDRCFRETRMPVLNCGTVINPDRWSASKLPVYLQIFLGDSCLTHRSWPPPSIYLSICPAILLQHICANFVASSSTTTGQQRPTAKNVQQTSAGEEWEKDKKKPKTTPNFVLFPILFVANGNKGLCLSSVVGIQPVHLTSSRINIGLVFNGIFYRQWNTK